ncbi:O-antigen/teichoic acid export membrane protein [Sphingomonas faeni]|nr:O-antigen/teichoic acid export membrane protein [Sphingomonas faeni]
MQTNPDTIGRAFVKGVRMVMIFAMPFYMGLAMTAEPLVLTVLGDKWRRLRP